MPLIQVNSTVQLDINEVLSGIAQLELSELEKFVHQVSYILAKKKVPSPPERELQLITKIYAPLKPTTQNRYDVLVEKMQTETISKEEHAELLKLTEIAEQHNVEWLQALVELSQIRQLSVDEVMTQLGISKRTHHL